MKLLAALGLEILYNTQQYTYNEYKKATLSYLLSEIGGSLGLYLGASIITLVELLTFSVTWLWYKFAPVPTSKIQPHRQRYATKVI
ncbi:hypothetical protein JTE90_026102 [Oedothorax gibbosus]|uniref:Uncharacterized protein n=1 Tax=Oedothorax gibbosus TaxID=931172 RepID=A0AAV6TQI4_9ARAC|nr:hypothetical protein JTE90_026102 [Oedothorax gibbosus]